MKPAQVQIPRYQAREVVGLDPRDARVVCISNSERSAAFCHLRWLYAYPQRLRPPTTARPLRFGDWFHQCLEDLYRWWRDTDRAYPDDAPVICPWCGGDGVDDAGAVCPSCLGTGRGPVARMGAEAERQRDAQQGQAEEDPRETAEAVARAFDGYLRFWGREPPRTYRIVDVEVAIARPILRPDGGSYCPEIPMVEEGGRWRMATAEDRGRPVATARWPWYQLGKLDAVGQDRRTGALWVIEHKSSQSPEQFFRGLSVDPQTTTYLRLLERAAAAGRYGAGARVAGYLYDVASSSMQHDPKILKPTKNQPGPTFSVAKDAGVPSWRFRAAIRREGVDEAPYREHLAYLADRDQRLYRRDYGDLPPEDLRRADLEVYAVARRLAQGRRDAHRATTPERVAELFPRSPICRQPGGSCPYRDICVRDTPDARRRYVRGDDQEWLVAPEAQVPLPVAGVPELAQGPAPYAGFDEELGF